MSKCDLCGWEVILLPVNRDIVKYDCPRCGEVEISGTMSAVFMHDRELDKIKYLLSGITRYRTNNNLPVITILSNNFEKLLDPSILDSSFVPRNFSDRLDLIIRYLYKKSEYMGQPVEVDLKIDYTIAFCKNDVEFIHLLNHLEEKGFILSAEKGKVYVLKFEGWDKVDELNRKVIKKKQGFIAMWFDDSMGEIYKKGFRQAIEDCGYEPMKIDLKQHNNKIDDEIMVEIRNSGFLVADFTGNRGGVYFEAGFAMGLGIDIIWTCRRSEIENLHFDTRQFNHITWETIDELYIGLTNRIKNTITI
ncbi:MAG: hypothetical protein JST15_07850 [Bacteroidetes bacterium]|nr:hypothetical protein [Bacteroidota bacterium]